MNNIRIILIVLIFIMSGCAEKEPDEHIDLNIVQNEIAVEDSIDFVWDQLVIIMSEPYFEIRAFNEKDHTMEFSFFSDDPCNYARCDIDPNLSNNAIGYYSDNDEDLKATCFDESTYLSKSEDGKTTIKDELFSFISGYSMLKLESLGDGTSITIDTNYTFHIVITKTEKTYKSDGKIENMASLEIEDKCEFSTLYSNSCDKLKEISCYSTGFFEKLFFEILEMQLVVERQ